MQACARLVIVSHDPRSRRVLRVHAKALRMKSSAISKATRFT
jgi:hypothetical protein